MPSADDSRIPGEDPAYDDSRVPEVPWDENAEQVPYASESGRHGERTSFTRWLIELAVLLAVAWVVALAVRAWVIQPFVIPSGSMEQTLQIDDRVLVNKFVYQFREPRAGDVVVFLSPDGDTRDYIKRVVAIGGQSVSIRDGVVYVDGARRVEPFTNQMQPDSYTTDHPIKVPIGYVFLMGDNRANSRDSRYFGAQPVSRILGEAFMIYWPVPRMSAL